MLAGAEGFEKAAEVLHLSEEEKKQRKDRLEESYMPFYTTEYYVKLISEQKEPIKTQMTNIIMPPVNLKPFEGHFDPYGNHEYRKDHTFFLQHKYPTTLLLHLNNHCFSNCQYCYKVNEIRHENNLKAMVSDRTSKAIEYLREHPEVNNILLTGGDPAMLSNDILIDCIKRLIELDNIRIIRLATKALSFYPNRFLNPELLEFLSWANQLEGKQVCIVAQISHPGEFSIEMEQAISAIQKAGSQIRAQPVFTKGVNSEVETLVDLHRKLIDHKILYYYIAIFMPVKGVEQYGMALEKVYKNVALAKQQLSGLEKKSILIVPHNFGKFELCGFYPNYQQPEKIILKWHQAIPEQTLPDRIKEQLNTKCEDLFMLDFISDKLYCMDDILKYNHLPYYDTEGKLTE